MNLVDEQQKIMQRRMAEIPELSYSTYCEYVNGQGSVLVVVTEQINSFCRKW